MKEFTLIFDGHCKLCNGTVAWILKHKNQHKFKFVSGQSPQGEEILGKLALPNGKTDSIVLISRGGKYLIESDAVLRIAKELGGLYRLATVFKFIPKAFRDSIYSWVARNRYRIFGRTEVCELDGSKLDDSELDGSKLEGSKLEE